MSTMQFRRATTSDIETVITWIPDAQACLVWAGPRVAFPLSLAQLCEAIEFDQTRTYALSDENCLLALGQIRLFDKITGRSRGHLSRIIVNPSHRRQGIGQTFVERLITEARRLHCQPITLHVVVDNSEAIRLYERVGFVTPAIQPIDLRPGIAYMELQHTD